MKYISQENAPIFDALERMKISRLVPFDGPSQQRGRGNTEPYQVLGGQCLAVGGKSMKIMGNLWQPV